MTEPDGSMLWANSGDAHLSEPPELFDDLPQDLRERMPRSVKDPSGAFETIFVDGQSFQRDLPQIVGPRRSTASMPEDADPGEMLARMSGGNDPTRRLRDLDEEGIWAELIYPSLGVWSFSIRTPDLARAGTRVVNDWAIAFQRGSPRFVCAASLPLLDVDDAVAELHRAADLGFVCGFIPVRPPIGRPDWQDDEWSPLWAAFAETGLVIGIHVGTEPHDPAHRTGVYHRGPGGAVLNYVETTYGGQRCVSQLIAGGALERHQGLKVLLSEGGATWGPFMADRMDEAYRQHGAAVRPKLSKLPSEYLYEQVYASFQHDRSAVAAHVAMGWQNIMWGSDYPHYEGTFGHTQKTLHELFDDVDPVASRRIRLGAFEALFPLVPALPAN
jgi:predicted TIM-barrel fold metal-dependent hydrolase